MVWPRAEIQRTDDALRADNLVSLHVILLKYEEQMRESIFMKLLEKKEQQVWIKVV